MVGEDLEQEVHLQEGDEKVLIRDASAFHAWETTLDRSGIAEGRGSLEAEAVPQPWGEVMRTGPGGAGRVRRRSGSPEDPGLSWA